mmetsp:Transcript_5992/g.25067  ORF Transcript_5992/g.25067 Transcript_5992/m.25067 type:complete len:293 (-) Transcript_5992:1191-2069(-)
MGLRGHVLLADDVRREGRVAARDARVRLVVDEHEGERLAGGVGGGELVGEVVDDRIGLEREGRVDLEAALVEIAREERAARPEGFVDIEKRRAVVVERRVERRREALARAAPRAQDVHHGPRHDAVLPRVALGELDVAQQHGVRARAEIARRRALDAVLLGVGVGRRRRRHALRHLDERRCRRAGAGGRRRGGHWGARRPYLGRRGLCCGRRCRGGVCCCCCTLSRRQLDAQAARVVPVAQPAPHVGAHGDDETVRVRRRISRVVARRRGSRWTAQEQRDVLGAAKFGRHVQ